MTQQSSKTQIFGMIYIITHKKSGRIYIGQTRNIKNRFSAHSRTNSPLGEDLRKYGKEDFEIVIAEHCSSKEEMNRKERATIKKMNAYDPKIGYNKKQPGQKKGWKPKNRKGITVMMRKEAWILAQQLAKKFGNIQTVAERLGTATSTIYKWGWEPNNGDPDPRITLELRGLAIKEGIIKS